MTTTTSDRATREQGTIEPLARPSTLLAMAVVTCSSFGWNVIVGAGPRSLVFAFGLAYLVVGTLGWAASERRGPRAVGWWLAGLTTLTCVALWASHLAVFLVAMPVIGLAAIYGGVRGGTLVSAVFLAVAAAFLVVAGATPVQVYAGSTGFLPGAVFVVVLAQLVVRERSARAQLRRYAAQVEELAVAAERNRIAREIHDSVGHYLTVVHVQLEAARALVGKDPGGAEACLGRAQALARDGLAELRRSVSMLRTTTGDERPFAVALTALVGDSRGEGLDATLAIRGTPRPLPPAVEFALYRAAQEALTNAVRHAQAGHVTCTLRYDDADVSVRIEDDGIGAVSTDGGLGLVGLRERIALVGGVVAIDPRPGRGFVVEARVPT